MGSPRPPLCCRADPSPGRSGPCPAFPSPAPWPSLFPRGGLAFRCLEETDVAPARAGGRVPRQGFSWTLVVGGSGAEAGPDVLELAQNALCSLIFDAPRSLVGDRRPGPRGD